MLLASRTEPAQTLQQASARALEPVRAAVAGVGEAAVGLFVVDTRWSVVALDQQSRALGEVQGQLGGQLVFVQVPITEKLTPGDTIVTAGLSLSPQLRSAYPKGLLIGTIQAVQQDQNALTQTAFVRPALDVQQVERLLVV